jgi:endonuclease G
MSQVARTSEDDAFERDAKPYARTRWKGAGIGYDPAFLSERIELPAIHASASAAGLVAPLLDGSGEELAYRRFSVVVHAKRKFALLTAVNIYGKQLKHPGARQTVWRQDARMDPQYQPAGNFYEKGKGSDKIQFSRGHLVRRFDPSWGQTVAEAKLGDEDTFHYANAAPQFQTYNDVDWGNLEDYVLDRAQTSEKKMSVFQGPIFRDDDPHYGKDREGGPWQVPLSFWKIAVLKKGPDHIAAAAFIIGQTQYVDALYEAKVFSGLRPYRLEDLRSRQIQTTIATVEKETGLDFSAIRRFDAHGSLESTRRTRWVNRLDDVLI